MSIISKKICIIGESRVNSNSLLNYLGDYQFSDKYLSLVGVTICHKTLTVPRVKPSEPLKLQLIIWNIAENTKYQAIAPSYLRGSSGAVIVADVSCPETIERLPEHIQLFSSVNPKGFIIIALHKSGLITRETLEKLTQLKDFEKIAGIYLTLVNNVSCVDEIFQKVAYKSLESCSNSYILVAPHSEIKNYSDLISCRRVIGDLKRAE